MVEVAPGNWPEEMRNHTPSPNHEIPRKFLTSVALSNQIVNLFSDILVHHMGKGLADGITQGSAGPDEFQQLRSGVWGNASFSSMTDGPAIWWRLSKPIRAPVARQIRSSTVSIS